MYANTKETCVKLNHWQLEKFICVSSTLCPTGVLDGATFSKFNEEIKSVIPNTLSKSLNVEEILYLTLTRVS